MQTYVKQQYGERTYTSLNPILEDPSTILMSSGASLQRPFGGDLDILSASQYPQGLMQPYDEGNQSTRKRKASSSDQLYGGVVVADSVSDGRRSSSVDQEARSTQKKKKQTKRASIAEVDDQVENKNKRGRPRLDTQDETAADRRRTQIRLAQRAYRHRKETTISALKQKVTNLHNTIEQMSKTFTALHDNMIDAGVLASHHSLGQQLQAATEEFAALSKAAAPDSDEEEEIENIANLTRGESKPSSVPDKSNRRSSGTSSRKSSSAAHRPGRVDVDSASSSDQLSFDARAEEELGLAGNKASHSEHSAGGNTDNDNNNNDKAPLDPTQPWRADNFEQQDLDVMDRFATAPEPFFFVDDRFDRITVERPLVPTHNHGSYTYSFQETTFARRLHRMSLERAFRNLANPTIDPEYIKNTFRFTFCFSNRKRMLQRFQTLLKRRAGESLENFNVPFFRIGGAGTHFPRRDDQGKPIYPPNLLSPARAFGPLPYVPIETPRAGKSTEEILEDIGFGGDWYDAHDVEEYLKTKGIYLDGQTSLVEVDPVVLRIVKGITTTPATAPTVFSSSTASSTSSPHPHEPSITTPSSFTAASIPPDFGSGDLYSGSTTFFGNMLASDAQPGRADGVNVLDVLWDDFTAQPSSTFFQDLQQQQQSPSLVTFDVEQFLDQLIRSGACLGRAPGFRKETVDKALALSLQESF